MLDGAHLRLSFVHLTRLTYAVLGKVPKWCLSSGHPIFEPSTSLGQEVRTLSLPLLLSIGENGESTHLADLAHWPTLRTRLWRWWTKRLTRGRPEDIETVADRRGSEVRFLGKLRVEHLVSVERDVELVRRVRGPILKDGVLGTGLLRGCRSGSHCNSALKLSQCSVG